MNRVRNKSASLIFMRRHLELAAKPLLSGTFKVAISRRHLMGQINQNRRTDYFMCITNFDTIKRIPVTSSGSETMRKVKAECQVPK